MMIRTFGNAFVLEERVCDLMTAHEALTEGFKPVEMLFTAVTLPVNKTDAFTLSRCMKILLLMGWAI